VVRRDYTHAHLWTLDVNEALNGPVVGKQRTKNKDFSVDSFSWSRDGARIAFSATVNPDLIQGVTSDVYLINLTNDAVTKLRTRACLIGAATAFISRDNRRLHLIYFASIR
jgi:hypothetical protein